MDQPERTMGRVKVMLLSLMLGFLILAIIPAAIFAAQEGSTSKSPESFRARTGAPMGLPEVTERDAVAVDLLSGDGAASQSAATVKAVLLKGSSGCSSTNRPWDTLNASWSSYGSIPLNIVYDDADLCSGAITYENLVASGADVLILDFDIGQYSADEIGAIKSYAEAGHNLFAAGPTFQGDGYDNRALAPVFGLQSAYELTTTLQYGVYEMVNSNDPIFAGMTNSYYSEGYFELQLPAIIGEWTSLALDGARYMARSLDQKAAITFYAGKGYQAIYVSNAVEYTVGYGPNNQDVQFIYNALTYPAVRKAIVVRSNGCNGNVGLEVLNDFWTNYGTKPIFIEFGHDQLCAEITLAELEASGADVVILSFADDPTFTNDELVALGQYADEGHNLIATYLSFGDYLNYDNRELAALFGLRNDLKYAYASVTPSPVVTQTISSTLFTDLPYSFSISTLTLSQTPPDISWDEDDLAGAIYAAKSDDNKTVVTMYEAPHYVSFYISGLPEFSPEADSSQLLYNAITFGSGSSGFGVYLPAILKSS